MRKSQTYINRAATRTIFSLGRRTVKRVGKLNTRTVDRFGNHLEEF